MSWKEEKKHKPKFGEVVLVYCRIYGRFLASYEQLDDSVFGNWSEGGKLGILPPLYWMAIPKVPSY